MSGKFVPTMSGIFTLAG